MFFSSVAVIVLIAVAIFFLLIAFSLFVNFFCNWKKSEQGKKNNLPDKMLSACPVCGSTLLKGENIISKVWQPLDTKQQRILVFGCPHCYVQKSKNTSSDFVNNSVNTKSNNIKRTCPRCHKNLSETESLVAHLFNLPSNKKHVTITGCVKCCTHNECN